MDTAMHLDTLDLNLLVALEALMRLRSVTAAAQEMHITQSAMSSALRRARAHFGDEILYYDGRAMVPTAFGQRLGERIPEMIGQLRTLSRMRPTDSLEALRRQFTLIASDYVSAVFISALSRRLSQLAPNVTLSVVPFTQEAIARFQRGVIDFLIAPDFALMTDYEARPLFRDVFRCVLWRDNPALPHAFTPEAYFTAPQVITNFFLENGNSHFERWLYGLGHPVRVAAALPSFVLLPHYVSGTGNVATIHKRLEPHFAGMEELVFVDPPVTIPPLQEYLVTTAKHHHDLEAQMLEDVMIAVAQEMDAPRTESASGVRGTASGR
jgi:LysR family nod box-dependent transcriptional activator